VVVQHTAAGQTVVTQQRADNVGLSANRRIPVGEDEVVVVGQFVVEPRWSRLGRHAWTIRRTQRPAARSAIWANKVIHPCKSFGILEPAMSQSAAVS
jgi:hypothetical protein